MTNQLTKRQVLAACRQWGVKDTQFKRWVNKGLLDQAGIDGRGYRAGIGRPRTAETVDRAILIARSLKDQAARGQKPSLTRAARVLLGAGYIVRSDIIRALLLDSVRDSERELWKHRQHFRSLDTREGRARLAESVGRRWGQNLPSQSIGDLQLATGILGGVSGIQGPLGEVGKQFSMEGQRLAIEQVGDAELIEETSDVVRALQKPGLLDEVLLIAQACGFTTVPELGDELLSLWESVYRVRGASASIVGLEDCETAGQVTLQLVRLWVPARSLWLGELGESLRSALVSSGGEMPDESMGAVIGWAQGVLTGVQG